METFQQTARAITSKPVQRAVVNTILLVSGAVTLFYLAAIASALFFQNFVPDQFVTTPVHLQYGSSSNPFGVASLSAPLLKSQQDYDISVTLSLPRSPANMERGNFMVSLYLLDSRSSDALAVSARRLAHGHSDLEHDAAVLFKSRRPALVPYVDPVVSLASRILFLFYHMLVPGSQTCTMIIPLAERVAFPRDSAIPASAYVEVEAGQGIQIYSAVLTMTAQLSGLRWLMFHYRLPTYFAFTSLFWVCELLFMSAAWTALSSMTASSPTGKHGLKDQQQKGRLDVKDELDSNADSGDLYTVKKEEELEHGRPLSEIPFGGAEADDEGDGDNWQRDSGIGTSYSEEGSGSVRRRASRNDVE